jgi:hypothetical protein
MDDIDPDEPKHAAFRPLFQEPSAAIEREHPSSGPLALVLGGMALPTMAEIADQYVLAAEFLVNATVNGDCEDFLVPNPLLFLYRQSVDCG